MSGSIPAVTQPPSDEDTKCPVCGVAVPFIAPHADLTSRFNDMDDASRRAHDEHCANHPWSEPVWNTLPERSTKRIVSVEAFIHYSLCMAADELRDNPILIPSWEQTVLQLYSGVALARFIARDWSLVLKKYPKFIESEYGTDWKNWIIESTQMFLTALLNKVWDSPEPESWGTPSLPRVRNWIEVFFRQDGAYATCGLLTNTDNLPSVPQYTAGQLQQGPKKRGRKKKITYTVPKGKKAKPTEVPTEEIPCEDTVKHINNADNPTLGPGDVILCRPGVRNPFLMGGLKECTVIRVNPKWCTITVDHHDVYSAKDKIKRQQRENRQYLDSEANSIKCGDREPWRCIEDFYLIEGSIAHQDPQTIARNNAFDSFAPRAEVLARRCFRGPSAPE
jgi:hypothetical protein